MKSSNYNSRGRLVSSRFNLFPFVLSLCVIQIFCEAEHNPKDSQSNIPYSFTSNNCPSYPYPVSIPYNEPVLKEAFRKLDSFLSNQRESLNLPALVCSVTYDQENIWNGSYGYKNPFNFSEGPPTMHSIIRIASITKVFTDLLLFKLRDLTAVNLDDPVVKFMPNFKVKNPYKTRRPITLRQLATHSSGLQREVPCPFSQMSNCTESEILERISRSYLLFEQYSIPHYSNLGIALLGRVLEKAMTTQYETLIDKLILKPLEMQDSGFAYNDYVKENMAIGMTSDSNGTWVRAPIEDLGWGNPMGGLFSTAYDISKLIALMFRTNEIPGGAQIVDGSTINEMLTPLLLNNDGYSGFGFPWEFNYFDSFWIQSKAGSLPGYRSQVALVPPIKLGIFCYGTADNDDSTQTMLTMPSLEILVPAFIETLWKYQKKNPLPVNAPVFTGLYRYVDSYSGNSDLEVYIREQTLFAAYTDGIHEYQRMNLTQFDETVFRVMLLDNEECRWLNDGSNMEFIYFTLENSPMIQPSSLIFMGLEFMFVTKQCPECISITQRIDLK